jgi:biopolymer transport protein ExbB
LLAIIEAAGWPIWPLIAASIIALAIIAERLWTLRTSVVLPRNLLDETLREVQGNGVTRELLDRLVRGSPLGRVLAAGLRHAKASREAMREAIEDAGRNVTHELGRFLTPLGTIASIAPIMGLLGTVIGMIEIFGSQSPGGNSPAQLAHGISVALYNTALGLIVAIPAMIFHRQFRAHVDSLVVEMEAQATRLIEQVASGSERRP